MKSPCEHWLDDVEFILGHDLDGDQIEDGYSLDYAVEAFRAGVSAENHAKSVKKAKSP